MWWIPAALALEVDPSPRWLDAGDVLLGIATLSFAETLVFPILDGEERVGFVAIGPGRAVVDFESPGEVLGLAARFRGEDPADLRAAIARQEWTDTVDRALIVGAEWELLFDLDALPVVRADAHGVFIRTDTGWEVVVSKADPIEALRQARAALAARELALEDAGIGLEPMLGSSWSGRAVAEWRTDRQYGRLPVLGDDEVQASRWLTWVRDESGAADARRDEIVVAHQDEEHAILTGRQRLGAPTAPTVTKATVNLVVNPDGPAKRVTAEARLVLKAASEASEVTLRVPWQREEELNGLLNPTNGGFVLEAVASGGVAALPVRRAWGLLDRQSGDLVEVTLPKPIAAGGTAVVDVRWKDRWAASHVLNAYDYSVHQLMDDGPCSGQSDCGRIAAQLMHENVELGRASAGHPVVPVVPWQSPAFPAQIRVGLGGGDRWVGVVSGAVPTERLVGEATWRITKGTALSRVSVGDYTEQVEDPVAGFPGLRVVQLGAGSAPQAAFARAVIHFYRSSLPAYPLDEITVAEDWRRPLVVTGDPDAVPVATRPGHGSLVVESRSVLGAVDGNGNVYRTSLEPAPYAVERGLVTAILHGWWGGLGWTAEDAWLGDAIVAFYRERFSTFAFTADTRAFWSDDVDRRVRELWVGDAPLPLPGQRDPWAGELGGRLFDRALRARIGETALLTGLDRFLRDGGPPTLARLRAALAATTDVPLDDFFETWVIAGLRPEVSGTWVQEDKQVRVTLAADPPLGRYEVPVRVAGKRGVPRLVWVRVVDGRGESLVAGNAEAVEIDPEDWLPLRGRRIRGP